MKEKFITASEVSNLLKINEKKVYFLAKKGVIPGTKITGKWLFPETKIKEFITAKSLENIKEGITYNLVLRNILLGAGSDDPILSNIFSSFYYSSGIKIFYSAVGSSSGIEFLKEKSVHFSLIHIYDPEKKLFNKTFVKKVFPNNNCIIVNLFKREIGLVSSEKIRSVEEFKDKKPIFYLRQKGSGTRIYTEHLFSSGILKKEWFKFSEEELFSHFDVSLRVKEEGGAVGIATLSSARIFNLYFLKLHDESFDLVTYKDIFFEKAFQEFYEFIRTSLSRVVILSGYDFSTAGKIVI